MDMQGFWLRCDPGESLRQLAAGECFRKIPSLNQRIGISARNKAILNFIFHALENKGLIQSREGIAEDSKDVLLIMLANAVHQRLIDFDLIIFKQRQASEV